MSRHRNLRQMVEDDYYDDDYDDDYYDDYDEHPRAPVKPKPTQAAAKNTSNKKAPAQQQQSKQSQVKQQQKQTAPVVQKNVVAGSASKGLTTASPPPPGFSGPGIPSSQAMAKQEQQQRFDVPKILLETDPNDKKRLTVVVLGHVDAGKSTVTGHLLYYNSKYNNNQSATTTASQPSNSNKKSATPTNFAWLLDENPQERAHGITMDIATKTLITKRHQIVLLDAPGHADHVPAMITGAFQAEASMLVVDVTDATSSGNKPTAWSEMSNTAFDAGQLKEHVYLARGLGVQQMLVVVNKMDMVGWSCEAFDRVVAKLSPFLNQVGFASNKLRFIPVSGLTGTNVYSKTIINKKDEPHDTKWFHGPTLMEALDEFDAAPSLQLDKPLRIIVTDVVGEQGKGVAVRGKIIQGWIKTGDALVVLPLGELTTMQKMTSLQPSESLERNKYAVAGEVIDGTLQNVDIMRVTTGNVLTRPHERPPLTSKCRAMIWILEGLTIPIIRGAQAIFHMHHLDIPCHLSMLVKTLKKDGTVLKDRPRALTANTQAIVELTLSVSIVMEAFNDCRAMGRFVLRRSGHSIAVGRIEQVLQ